MLIQIPMWLIVAFSVSTYIGMIFATFVALTKFCGWEKTTDSLDGDDDERIAASIFWPVLLAFVIVLSPIILMQKFANMMDKSAEITEDTK